MTGISRKNGESLKALAHIRQSVRDIITTPIGSRVMRRDYGSRLPELIDMPQNEATLMQCYAAVVMAVTRWEPRIRVSTVTRRIDEGRVVFEIKGRSSIGPTTFEVPVT